jgi:hypothetical protein
MHMLNIKNKLWFNRLLFHFRHNFALYTLIIIYSCMIALLNRRGELFAQGATLEGILVICFGIVTLFLIENIVSIVCGNNRRYLGIGRFILILLYLILSVFHLNRREMLDYAIIADNTTLVFYRESIMLVLNQLTLTNNSIFLLIICMLLIISLAVIEMKWHLISTPIIMRNRIANLFIYTASYLLLIYIMPYTYDEIASFIQSSQRYYSFELKNIPMGDVDAPTMRHFQNAPKDNQPNIFLIMVESFNANFVRAKTPEGKEYTPFLNSLINRGLYYNNFYGNSVQTAHGQLATLCSVFPLTSGKVFTDCPNLRLKCLPEIMKTQGYQTLFFQGFSDLSFDNTGQFMQKNGFQYVSSMDDKSCSRDELRKYSGGWGIQDDILYRKTFLSLDHFIPKNTSTNIPNFFVVIATISSHMDFTNVPATQRYLYPQPQNEKECYANAIRVMDEYLRTFFDELGRRKYLRNNIIIITGDHSYPAGEHGIFQNENGFYEEFFKTPLIIIGSGIKPAVISKPHSQLDIAPTILELSGISTTTHFRGNSVFKESSEPIYLLQPYAGKYLAVVRHPYKYIFSIRFNKEYIYNLENDPHENLNLFQNTERNTHCSIFS